MSDHPIKNSSEQWVVLLFHANQQGLKDVYTAAGLSQLENWPVPVLGPNDLGLIRLICYFSAENVFLSRTQGTD